MVEQTNRLRGVEVYKLWWCWSMWMWALLILSVICSNLTLHSLSKERSSGIDNVCEFIYSLWFGMFFFSHLCMMFSYSLLQNAAVNSILFRATATDKDFGPASIVSFKIDEVCSLPWHKLHFHSHISLELYS